MPAEIDEGLCEGCGVCVPSCPERALVKKGEKIVVAKVFCRSCGVCEDNCPAGAIAVRGDD